MDPIFIEKINIRTLKVKSLFVIKGYLVSKRNILNYPHATSKLEVQVLIKRVVKSRALVFGEIFIQK